MSSNEATLYEIRNGAAWITLNRPENRNALSAILVTELYDHLTQANADDKVRSIVITGSGPAFCGPLCGPGGRRGIASGLAFGSAFRPEPRDLL